MNFDHIAPHYRWLEWLFAGRTLQRCRTNWLKEARDCQEVLIVGEGDGRFVEVAAKILVGAQFTCVDGSEAMLALAKKRCPQAEMICARLPEWEAPVARYDLIVTHFFLDCLEEQELTQTIAKLGRAAKPEALWLLADFRLPESKGAGRVRAKLILKIAYWFFHLTTGLPARCLVDSSPMLSKEGFVRIRSAIVEWGLLGSEVWERKAIKNFETPSA